MLEEARKYEVDPRFAVPDLSGCLPDGGTIVAAPPAPLRATYYDTADRRLARAGVSLRFRRGDPLPWTVKLPTGVVGVRQGISPARLPATLPGRLVPPLTAVTPGRGPEPAALLPTT